MKIITRDAHILVNNARADGARGPEASTTNGNIRLKRIMLLPIATRWEYRNAPVFIARGLVHISAWLSEFRPSIIFLCRRAT